MLFLRFIDSCFDLILLSNPLFTTDTFLLSFSTLKARWSRWKAHCFWKSRQLFIVDASLAEN